MTTKRCPLDEWPYFDLRVSLIDDEKSFIHFGIDLIIADTQSIELILKKLFYFYERPDKSPEKIHVTFCDYVLSLQKYQNTQAYRNSIRYWDKKFTKISPGPDLPIINGGLTTTTERLEGVLDNWNALRETAERLSVTPGIILLAAYAEVLTAWSNSESFSIVIPG